MLYDWTRGYEHRKFKRIKIGGEADGILVYRASYPWG